MTAGSLSIVLSESTSTILTGTSTSGSSVFGLLSLKTTSLPLAVTLLIGSRAVFSWVAVSGSW